MRYRASAVAVIVGFGIVIGGCGGSSDNSSASGGQSAEGSPIRVGWQPDPDAELFLARGTKLLERYGLKPQYVQFQTGVAELAALAKGDIDVAEVGMAPFVLGVSNGVPIKLLTVSEDDSGTNALVARDGAGITSVKDLAGKRLAATAGSASYYSLISTMRANGLSKADTKFLNLAPTAILASFSQKTIDAAWVWSPWAQKLQDAGGTVVTTARKAGVPAPGVFVGNSKWLQGHHDEAVNFVKAMSDASGQIKDKADIVIKQIMSSLNVSSDLANYLLSHIDYPSAQTMLDPSYAMTVADYNSGSRGLGAIVKSIGAFLSPKGFPLESSFDPQYLKAAAGQ